MYFGLKYILGKTCFFGKNGGRISENKFYSDLGKKVSPKHRAHLLFLAGFSSHYYKQNHTDKDCQSRAAKKPCVYCPRLKLNLTSAVNTSPVCI